MVCLVLNEREVRMPDKLEKCQTDHKVCLRMVAKKLGIRSEIYHFS